MLLASYSGHRKYERTTMVSSCDKNYTLSLSGTRDSRHNIYVSRVNALVMPGLLHDISLTLQIVEQNVWETLPHTKF